MRALRNSHNIPRKSHQWSLRCSWKRTLTELLMPVETGAKKLDIEDQMESLMAMNAEIKGEPKADMKGTRKNESGSRKKGKKEVARKGEV